MTLDDKVVVTCALTGILTDPKKFNVPVSPQEMAAAARQAFDQGATIVHCHFRDQRPGMGNMWTWDLETVGAILGAIKEEAPEIIINMSTGALGDDIGGPLACLETYKPEMAACNAGSLNYLKIKKDGSWAWPPILFDNLPDKIGRFLDVMTAGNIIPEFECFDTGIVRSVGMYQKGGMFQGDPHFSFVMNVDSGMPANPDLLPILVEELPPNSHWQIIAIGARGGKWDIWELHRRAVELGGNVRTGLEDTLYLPGGDRADNNGVLVEALVNIVLEQGKEPASAAEARQILGIKAG